MYIHNTTAATLAAVYPSILSTSLLDFPARLTVLVTASSPMARQLLFACGLLALMALSSGEHRRRNVPRWLDVCVIVMAAMLDAASCSCIALTLPA